MKKEKLLDKIDDKRILSILNSNKKIENDSEFVYYYALPDIRAFNNYIKRVSKYEKFLSINNNTRFLEFSIYTIANKKIFTYSHSYSLNKNLNKLHIALENFRNQINDEIIQADKVKEDNILFIKNTAEKIKRSILLKKNKLNINVLLKDNYIEIYFIYGNIKIKFAVDPFDIQRSKLLKDMQVHFRNEFLFQISKMLERKLLLEDFEYETCVKIIKWYLDKSYSSKISFLHLAIEHMTKDYIPSKYKDRVLALSLMANLKEISS